MRTRRVPRIQINRLLSRYLHHRRVLLFGSAAADEREFRDPAAMVNNQGRGPLHRDYVVEAGNHVDQLYDEFPNKLRPISPCYLAAFVALEN
jgi:hypothetical protein